MYKFIICILLIVFSISANAQNRRSSTTKEASPSVKPSSKTKEVKTPSSTSKDSKKTAEVNTENAAPEAKTEPVSAGKKPFFAPKGPMTKMSTTIEFGAYPSDADLTLINIYGHLGMNFDISRRLYFGPYFKHKIMSTHEYQVMPIEGKTLDVASFNEWGAGFSFGSYFPISSKFLLTPELRIGYNEYTMQDLSYTAANKNFLNHKYLSAMTRMNFGFKLSDYTIFNFSGGYILPYYLSGNKTTAYDPGTFMYGVGVKFYMQAH
jgi:hypothetical protein